jgi:hypothetical protein
VNAPKKVLVPHRRESPSRQRLALLKGWRHAAVIDADTEQVAALDAEIAKLEGTRT